MYTSHLIHFAESPANNMQLTTYLGDEIEGCLYMYVHVRSKPRVPASITPATCADNIARGQHGRPAGPKPTMLHGSSRALYALLSADSPQVWARPRPYARCTKAHEDSNVQQHDRICRSEAS